MINHISNKRNEIFDFEKITAKMSLSEVFRNRGGFDYINELTLFTAHFNRIPNLIEGIEIDCKKANLWFAEHYATEIKESYYNKRYYRNSKKSELDDVFYLLYEDLIVDFDTNNSIVRFLFHRTDLSIVERIVEETQQFKIRKQRPKSKTLLLVNTNQRIRTREMQINKPKLSIADNYNPLYSWALSPRWAGCSTFCRYEATNPEAIVYLLRRLVLSDIEGGLQRRDAPRGCTEGLEV